MPKIETLEVCRGGDGKFVAMKECCPENTGCCTSGERESTHESQSETTDASTGSGLGSLVEPTLELVISACDLIGSWLTAKSGGSSYEDNNPYDPDDLTNNP